MSIQNPSRFLTYGIECTHIFPLTNPYPTYHFRPHLLHHTMVFGNHDGVSRKPDSSAQVVSGHSHPFKLYQLQKRTEFFCSSWKIAWTVLTVLSRRLFLPLPEYDGAYSQLHLLLHISDWNFHLCLCFSLEMCNSKSLLIGFLGRRLKRKLKKDG